MASKKAMHPDIRKSASFGDLILNSKMDEYVYLNPKSKEFCNEITSILKSNQFIQHFHCGFKHNYTSPKKKGDMVEAWIYFLYINYGIKSVDKYLKEELSKIKYKLDNRNIKLKLWDSFY